MTGILMVQSLPQGSVRWCSQCVELQVGLTTETAAKGVYVDQNPTKLLILSALRYVNNLRIVQQGAAHPWLARVPWSVKPPSIVEVAWVLVVVAVALMSSVTAAPINVCVLLNAIMHQPQPVVVDLYAVVNA